MERVFLSRLIRKKERESQKEQTPRLLTTESNVIYCAMMNEDRDHPRRDSPTDIFNPTKVCELRLAGAHRRLGKKGGEKKEIKRIMFLLMAPIPSVSCSTHPLLLFFRESLPPFKPRTLIKKVFSQELRRVKTEYKNENGTRGVEEGESARRMRELEKEIFYRPRHREISFQDLGYPYSTLLTFYRFPLSPHFPRLREYKAVRPFRACWG